MDNPYAPVREEVSTFMEGDTKCVVTISYDALGRKVGYSHTKEYADGRKGHCARCVEEDGYWYGGCGEEMPDGTYMECVTAPRKFDPSEI